MGITAHIEILRPLNCIMAAIGVFIGFSIAALEISFTAQLGIAMAVAFLVCAGGIAINDVYDAAIDAKLHPNKPIPSGRISKRAALYYSKALFVLAVLIALYYLPFESFVIAVAFSLLFIAYSRWLPKFKYIGNWVVASGTAFTLIFGASLVQNYTIVALFAIAALFANAAREIVKDIEDMKQDRGFKVSLPMIRGREAAKRIAIICTALAVTISYGPKFLGFGGLGFLALLTIVNLSFVVAVRYLSQNNYSRSQKAYKRAMLLALIAFLLGVAA